MAKLTIEVPAEEVTKAIGDAYKKNKGKFNVPGFRKGHVPQKMIEKMFDKTALLRIDPISTTGKAYKG